MARAGCRPSLGAISDCRPQSQLPLLCPTRPPCPASTPAALPPCCSAALPPAARHTEQTGELTCLVISDLDAGVGKFAFTMNTVNSQNLQARWRAV